MKKITTSIFFSLALSTLLAQQSAIKIEVGYGMPLNSANIGTSNVSQNNGNTNTNIQSVLRGSFGSGTRVEVGYTHSLSGLLSVQLDATYLIGKQYNTGSSQYTYQGNNYGNNTSNRSNMFMVSPQIRAKLGDGKLVPYVSVGPVIGFGKMYEKADYKDYDSNPYSYEFTYSGSAAVGAKTSVGVEFTQGKFGYYVQATVVNLNYAPTKGVYTKYIDQYGDRLANMNAAQKEMSFVNSYDANAQTDPNQPTKVLKQYYPFSSISLNFGVMYHF